MRTHLLLLTMASTMSLGLIACSTAQMVVDQELVTKSDQYEISERPRAIF